MAFRFALKKRLCILKKAVNLNKIILIIYNLIQSTVLNVDLNLGVSHDIVLVFPFKKCTVLIFN